MQHLQWFPGHMTAAIRMMEENLKFVDGIITVLDARAYKASINREFIKLFSGKKVLYVVNKSDLIPVSDAKRIVNEMEKEGLSAVSVSAMDKRAVDLLYDKIFSMLKEKIERNKEKGLFRPMRIMVAGIPNTGKSTIINALAGGKKTITGNKAGVTRGKQWVRIKELELLDTPGTMPPAFSDQTMAKHLAYIGCMNDANIDFNDLAYELIKELTEKRPEVFKEKYGDINLDDIPLLIDEICKKRGFLLKGGNYDYDRFSASLIDDFRKIRLGKICLE